MERNDDADQRFDDLMRVYELYTNLQLQAETIYYNRSNLLLVAQGLLFVAIPQTLQHRVLAEVIAALGLWLSALWWGLEQRQRIHQQSREDVILKPLESELCLLAETASRGFRPFWARTAEWVKENAKPYQRQSTRHILRNLTPLTFIICWGAILVFLLAGIISAPTR